MSDIIKNLIEADEVKLSLEKYNRLRDENKKLRDENARLKKERDEICDKNKVRVVYSPAISFNEVDDVLKNFDDVKEDVKEHYDDELKAHRAAIEALEKSNNKLSDKVLELEIENNDLRSRNLWQRIWNK